MLPALLGILAMATVSDSSEPTPSAATHHGDPVLFVWPDSGWFMVRNIDKARLIGIVNRGRLSKIARKATAPMPEDPLWFEIRAWFTIFDDKGAPQIAFVVEHLTDGSLLVSNALIQRTKLAAAIREPLRYLINAAVDWMRIDPYREISSFAWDYLGVDAIGQEAFHKAVRDMRRPVGEAKVAELDTLLQERPHEVIAELPTFLEWIRTQ